MMNRLRVISIVVDGERLPIGHVTVESSERALLATLGQDLAPQADDCTCGRTGGVCPDPEPVPTGDIIHRLWLRCPDETWRVVAVVPDAPGVKHQLRQASRLIGWSTRIETETYQG